MSRATVSRWPSVPLNGRPATMPAHDNAAILEGRTIYPSTVTSPRDHRALKSGEHWHKIGAVVLKGRWRGFPIFTLSLEERRTCRTACRHYRSCYGNHMRWLQRMEAGPDLEWKLAREVALLSIDHPNFVVRLHGMGDFYSRQYVELWRTLLARHEGLHIFGYTARLDDDIGDALRALAADVGWQRFAMRFSNSDEPMHSTLSIEHAGQRPADSIICPEQVGRAESCSTCALCWQTEKRICFLHH